MKEGVRGYKPKRIVPVLLLSEEVISAHPLQTYVEKVAQAKIFQNIEGITPWVLLSPTEMETLCSIDFSKTKWTFNSLLLEKADKANYMNWSNFLSLQDLPKNEDSDAKKFVAEQLELAKPLLGEGADAEEEI